VIAPNDRKQPGPLPEARQPAEGAPQPAEAAAGVGYSMPRFVDADSFSERRAEALIRMSGLDWDDLVGQFRRGRHFRRGPRAPGPVRPAGTGRGRVPAVGEGDWARLSLSVDSGMYWRTLGQAPSYS
jgi:hypothetical protein